MNKKFITSIVLTLTITITSCGYNPKITSKTNDVSTNIDDTSKKENNNKVLFSKTNDDIICNLTNCVRKPFDIDVYNKLFNNNEIGPIGATVGTYYNIDNSYGLDIYAAGYTEEGEVDFDYIIVSNGNKTRYIELPMNSNYSITNNLAISGYSSTASNFSYKIDIEGNIINSTP